MSSESPQVTVLGGAEPAQLLDAFWGYEAALMDDDLDVLAAYFSSDAGTMRADANGLLVGPDAIAGFRGARGGAPARSVERIEVRVLAPDLAYITAVNAPAAGGRGLVTQLWIRDGATDLLNSTSGGWRIRAAHVSAPPAALDPRIWRVVGAPLVAGVAQGPLAGETVAVKDIVAVEGFAIGAGVRAYLAQAPIERRSAPAVQSLLEAGADLRGIAQTDQFAYSIAGLNPDYGTPPNPAVLGAIPGGSSSGPASAVALGHASIGLGTDTAGSVRVPASYQGLWGLRPTHGAISLEGVLPLAPSYDTVGLITRDGDTLLRASRAALGERESAGLGAYVSAPQLLDALAPEVAEAFTALLASLGVTAQVPVPPVRALFETFRVTQSAQAWRSDGAWVEAHPGALGSDIQARFDFARDVTAEQEQAGLVRLQELTDALDTALGESVLLLPSAASSAPRIGTPASELNAIREATLAITAIAGFTGRPALSAPLMVTSTGPVGLCLVGPRGSDLALIESALALESALVQED
jgi:Asp-tRNA(Asn)/Glu-tRNA(Gln) amidotransferase A subunit family amidase